MEEELEAKLISETTATPIVGDPAVIDGKVEKPKNATITESKTIKVEKVKVKEE